MQWMFAAMQVFMAKETVAKMSWMSYGSELYKDLGSSVPKAYGGSGPNLDAGGQSQTPRYIGQGAGDDTSTTTRAAPAPAPLSTGSGTAPAGSAPISNTKLVETEAPEIKYS